MCCSDGVRDAAEAVKVSDGVIWSDLVRRRPELVEWIDLVGVQRTRSE